MAYKIPAVSAISNQFPEFVKEDYPRFIRFVELYYEFLKNSELDGIGESFDSIRDIDVTLDKFVDSLWKEFGINVPRTSITNDKHFLKHIKEFYSTKGSEESFRILFRHLFNTEIELTYPKEYILKTSDGEWVQDVSFLVSVSKGDIFDIVGQQISISTSLQTIHLLVNRVRPLGDFFEVFIEISNLTNLISHGDIISFGDVVGSVVKTISKVSIVTPGTGFYVGQIFTIPSVLGSDAQIKVNKVGNNGTLLGVELLDFGTNYQFDYYVTIASTAQESQLPEFPTIHDQTLGFKDYGFISSDYYFEQNIVNPSYTGVIVTEFYTDSTTTTNASILQENVATLEIKIGSIRKYQGYYKTDAGFLSNSYKLQDSYYYQIYSYVISCVESITKYRDIVKTLVHPTGMKLFGIQSLSNEFSLRTSIEILNRFFQLASQEEVFFTDIESYFFSKPVSETLLLSEIETLLLNKPVSDALTIGDLKSLGLRKPVSELPLTLQETLSSSFAKYLYDILYASSDLIGYCDIDYCDPTYYERVGIPSNVYIDEIVSFGISKSLSDTFSISELETLRLNKATTDSLTTTESNSLTYYKPLTDLISNLADNSSISVNKSFDESLSLVDSILFDRYKELLESLSLIDSNVLSFSKSLIETLSLSDTDSINVNKPFNDYVSFEGNYWVVDYCDASYILDEDLPNFAISKVVEESLASLDSSNNSFNKSLTDTFGLTDIFSISMDRILQFLESLSISDNTKIILGKSISDNFNLTDTIEICKLFELLESLSISESNVLSFSKSLIESLIVSDTDSINFNKPLDEYVSFDEIYCVVDYCNAGYILDEDIPNFTINKPVEESLTTLDSSVNSFEKLVTDSITTIETKTLLLTKYITDTVSILGSYYWDSTYGPVDYTDGEAVPIINYVGSTYNISLNN